MKRKMKLLVIWCLALALLCACGSPAGSTSGSSAPAGSSPAAADPGSAAEPAPTPDSAGGEYPALSGVKFSIGTGTAGGSAYVYTGGIAKIANENVPGLEIIMEATTGGGGHIPLIHSGELGMGYVEASLAETAYNGTGDYAGAAVDDLRVMFWCFGNSFISTTLDDGYTNITDFDGKTVAVGPIGGATDMTSRNVFNLLGISPNVVNMGWGDSFTAMYDDQSDAVTGACVHPASSILELESKADVKWVPLTEEQLELIVTTYPTYQRVSLPADMYASLSEDFQTFASMQCMYTSSQYEEDVVYAITKAVMEHIPELTAIQDGGKTTSCENLGGQSVPLHAGAYRYCLEAGIEVPDHLIPPEYNG